MASYNNTGLKVMSMKDCTFRRSQITSPILKRELSKKDFVDLTGIAFHHFDMYEYWSSTEKLLTYQELVQKDFKATFKTASSDYENLLLSYDFAVTLEEPRFQDAVVSKIIRRPCNDIKDQSIFVRLLTESTVTKLANT